MSVVVKNFGFLRPVLSDLLKILGVKKQEVFEYCLLQ